MAFIKTAKKAILFLCCLLYFVHSVAQNEITNNLQKKLTAAKDPKEIINIRNLISAELRLSDADSAANMAHTTLALAQKINYEYGIAVSNLCIALANSVKGNYRLTEEYANRALLIAQKLNNDSLKASGNLQLAVVYENNGDYANAIIKALLAVEYYTKLHNTDGVARSRLVMAQLYQTKNDLPAAEKILKELSDEPAEDKKLQINILHTLANIYGMQEKYKEALQLDEKALRICDVYNIKYLKSSVYDNMANCYMYSGNYAKAKIYFFKSLEIDKAFNNKKQLADTYLNLGQLSLMEGNNVEAIKNLQNAIMLATVSEYKLGLFQAYLSLSKAYNKNKQTDSALYAVNQGYLIKDSFINEKTESKIAEMETLYQTQKKEQKLLLQKSEINKKNYLLLALSIATLLIIFSGIFYYRRRSLQNKITIQTEVLKQQDLATKAIIEAEENERKRIAADLHDGVGQMMSATRMNLSVFENEFNFENEKQRVVFENIIGMVDESCKEIRNVSHQMMPNALLKSGLANAVREFISKIDDRIIKVTLHTEGLNERLDGNIETVLYRVIQECVNNVLKHAQANHLDISILKEKNDVAITIEDNGIGFNIADKEKFEGIGLKNIASRIKYLQGNIDFSSEKNKGTLVAIHIPISVT